MHAGLIPAVNTGIGLPVHAPAASQVRLVQPVALLQAVPASKADAVCVIPAEGVHASRVQGLPSSTGTGVPIEQLPAPSQLLAAMQGLVLTLQEEP
jgi:hypothetical protein